MKISGRGGHNELCPGARALLDEVNEDRKIFAASKKYLSTKHEFIDCTPAPIAGQNNDLSYGINKANNSKSDYFYSVHLNKAYNNYDGRIGAEIWLLNENSKLISEANRILNNLEKLGFKNRGIKYAVKEGKRLAELISTIMPAMIIECFFLEATEDVAVYEKVGADAIGFAIANGIDTTILKEASKKYYVVTNYIQPGKYGIELISLWNKYFYDLGIERIYLETNEKGTWLETQYMDKGKAQMLADRLKADNLLWELKEE
jgi:N-acetylmuramoyl-L-alanine amidase